MALQAELAVHMEQRSPFSGEEGVCRLCGPRPPGSGGGRVSACGMARGELRRRSRIASIGDLL
ncbi:hypothetical protein AB0451_07890 [Streptomyces sp. NPDC052000]|uniref:hypothetical protein n=1 Tax=Streptomyces sp. NPDC052000 TaxID=3155676 RepID=UPI00344C992B